MNISNWGITPGYVEAMHCCMAPLWGGRLGLNSLNQTPRFAHRPLLLLRLVVVKKGPHEPGLLGAVVEPSEVLGVDNHVLFAKLVRPLVHGVPFAGPATQSPQQLFRSWQVFMALRERRGPSGATARIWELELS